MRGTSAFVGKPKDIANKCLESEILVFLYLTVLAIFVRLPFFFPAVINWDESTFILMGQSILDGNLPYTELWDLKPPFAFVFYALSILLFGKSIIAVRIAGALCVAIASYCTYITGKSLWNKNLGILSASVFIVFVSLLPSGQAVMTQHVALVPLLGALALLTSRNITPTTVFSSGALLAVACLVRLNLAYVALFVGMFITLFPAPKSRASLLQRGFYYGLGFSAVVMASFIPYLFTGNAEMWFKSVIIAPLSYTESQHEMMDVLKIHAKYIMNDKSPLGDGMTDRILLLWAAAAIGYGYILIKSIWSSKEVRYKHLLLIVFVVATLISILRGGAAHAHYLLQLAPFVSLSAVACLEIVSYRFIQTVAFGVGMLLLVISVKQMTVEYYPEVFNRILTNQALVHGTAFDIANYLKKEKRPGDSIYFMTDHIAAWLIDAKPLTKMSTHPSNIAKDYLLRAVSGPNSSTEEEMKRILATHPEYIVKKNKVPYLRDKPEAVTLLESELDLNYKIVTRIHDRLIYQRLKSGTF